eukprot:TRINITY_DN3136_c1_g3_i1.p1 TRINITY_DN3136_c1_g3~~TRINITY_DN3136_c1_g3_i1.p1  ORF type:complete len:577 (-),score=114.37 TRINITY_DN3136_c1_g3_i1:122-1852(-)
MSPSTKFFSGKTRQSTPLLGAEAVTASQRHANELDDLSLELHQQRLHHAAVEPRLLREHVELRRLRRDLQSSRREAILCERSLERHERERSVWERQSNEEACKAMALEAAAARQVEENPWSRRQMCLEDEAETFHGESEVLMEEVRNLLEAKQESELQLRSLSAAVAQHAGDLGVAPATLYNLGNVRERFSSDETRIKLAGAEANGVMRESHMNKDKLTSERRLLEAESAFEARMRQELPELHAAMRAHSAEITRTVEEIQLARRELLGLDTFEYLKGSKDRVGLDWTEGFEGRSRTSNMTSILVSELMLRQSQLREGDRALMGLEHARKSLMEDLEHVRRVSDAAVKDQSVTACTLEEQNADVEFRRLELCLENAADQSLMDKSKPLIEGLQLDASRTRGALLRFEANWDELLCLHNEMVIQDRSLLSSLGDARSAEESLLAACRASLEATRSLETSILEERRVGETSSSSAFQLQAERDVNAEEVCVAMRRCQDTLAAAEFEEADALRHRDACLRAQLTSRDEIQASLTFDIDNAVEELRVHRDCEAFEWREIADLRRENATLRRMLGADCSGL